MSLKRLLLDLYNRFKKLKFAVKPSIKANIVKLGPTDLLSGRNVLITGGSSGIGYAIADAMLNAGAHYVIIVGRDEDKCKRAVSSLVDNHITSKGCILYEVMNVKDVKGIDARLDAIIAKMKGQKLDVLVNCAGVQGGRFGTATEEDYDNVMDTNYKGTFFLSQAFANYMIKNHIQGNILNIASSSSIRPSNSAYSISKSCIKDLTAGMAKTLLPYGINVNGIAPGPTATPLMNLSSESYIDHPSNPLGRFALPEEIANMAVILVSDMGRTIVGSLVYMTGGSGIITFDDIKYGI